MVTLRDKRASLIKYYIIEKNTLLKYRKKKKNKIYKRCDGRRRLLVNLSGWSQMTLKKTTTLAMREASDGKDCLDGKECLGGCAVTGRLGLRSFANGFATQNQMARRVITGIGGIQWQI